MPEITQHISQSKDSSSNTRSDVYQRVTDLIIAQLESGTVPWKQCWSNSGSLSMAMPKNAVTHNYYRGINIVLLWCAAQEQKFPTQEWASLKQWNKLGKQVAKGQKGSLVVYADTLEKEEEGEVKKISFLKHSFVFNKAQLVGAESILDIVEIKPEPLRIQEAEEFVVETGAKIVHQNGDAYYRPSQDLIYMPNIADFNDANNCTAQENYYATLFHELTHWTGHNTRLNRQIKNRFGSKAYAAEELIGELGASYLCSMMQINTPEAGNHAAYIDNWLKVLKENKQFIVAAASEASKAVDYLAQIQPVPA